MSKLSISNIAWNPDNNETVFDMMLKYHFTGLEIAPSIIFGSNTYEKHNEAVAFANKLYQNYGISVCSMQSIWFGRQEELFKNKSHRDFLMQYTIEAMLFANKMNCPNLVFGCPKNRNVYNKDDYEIAVDFFHRLGEFAYSCGTVLSIEANPVIYNTNFLNSTKDALDFVKKVNSSGVRLNLDLGTMIFNREDPSLIKGQVQWIHHVHISEPELKRIVPRQIHKNINNILTEESYKNFISIEMKASKNIYELENILNYTSNIFEEK